MRVLIIEDDEKTAHAIAAGLEAGGFSATAAHTGEEGFFLLNAEPFDLVVLDWMLPGRDGIEILRTLRTRGAKTPVLLLTARDAIEDRCSAWKAGPMITSSSPLPLRNCWRAFGRCCAGPRPPTRSGKRWAI